VPFRKLLTTLVPALLAALLLAGCGGGGRGDSFSISPASLTITTWEKRQFTASSPAYWDVQEPGGGFFDGPEGVYTASYLPGTYHVIARKQSNNAVTATATVRVVAPAEASITCPPVVNHDAMGLTASVTQNAGWTYAWSLQGATILSGQSTSVITFDAPKTGTLSLTCIVRNEAGKDATGTANITVAPAPVISAFSAAPATLLGGQSTRLTATFSGATAQVDGVGTIRSGVPLDTLPLFTTTYTLRVANQAGEEITATCPVLVTPVVTSSDPTPVIAPGGTLTPVAAVIGSPDPSLTWELQETATGGFLTNSAGTWTYTAPTTPGTYHLIARSTATPSAQLVVPITVFESFSAFRVGGYAVAPYDDRAAQPTAFGWARQSRFTGPRAAGGPQKVFSLASGNSNAELLLGPRGEFYTAGGKKWDAYGRAIPTFTPANNYDLTAPVAMDRQGRLLIFDYLFATASPRLCALDPDTGALRWATTTGWEGAVSCRLTLAEDGRMAVWNNWTGSVGNTLQMLSSEGVVLWTKDLHQFGEAVFAPDGSLLFVGYQMIIKWDAAGNEVWRLAEKVTYDSLYNGYHPRAVVGADGTFFVCSTSDTTEIYGLTAIRADGTVLWRCPLPQTGPYDPYLTLTQDGSVICGLYNTATPIVAVDANGQIKWQYTLPSGMASYGEALVDRDGTVYIAPRTPWPNTTGRLLAFTAAGAPLWGLDLPLGYYGVSRLTLGPRHELYVTWDGNTWVFADPPSQP